MLKYQMAVGQRVMLMTVEKLTLYSRLAGQLLIIVILIPLALLAWRLNNFISADRLKNWDNNVNTIGYVLQSMGNDYGRVARRSTDVADQLQRDSHNIAVRLEKSISLFNSNLQRIQSDTLPAVNNTARSFEGLGNASTLAVQRFSIQSEVLMDNSNELVREVKALLKDPRISEILTNAVDTTENIDSLTEQMTVTNEEINKALPELLKQLQAISSNTAGATKETHEFIKALNKPRTKKERVLRFILESVLKSSPVLLGR